MSEDNCSFCGHGKKYHVWDQNLLGMTCLGNDNDCSCGRNFAPSLSEYNQLVSERDALKTKLADMTAKRDALRAELSDVYGESPT